MVDLLLLKYCDVKKRSDQCIAIAKSYAVDVGDQILIENRNRTLEVIKVSRNIDFDAVDIIGSKIKIHKVCGIVNISHLEIPTNYTAVNTDKEDKEC